MTICYLRRTLSSGIHKKTDNSRDIASKYIGIFVLLNLWDLLLTIFVIQRRGIEIMPMAKSILQNFGPLGLACWKVLMPGILCFMVLWASNYTPKVQFKRVVRSVNVIMFIACVFMTISALTTAFSPWTI